MARMHKRQHSASPHTMVLGTSQWPPHAVLLQGMFAIVYHTFHDVLIIYLARLEQANCIAIDMHCDPSASTAKGSGFGYRVDMFSQKPDPTSAMQPDLRCCATSRFNQALHMSQCRTVYSSLRINLATKPGLVAWGPPPAQQPAAPPTSH